MGFLEDIGRKVKSDVSYRTGSEASSAIGKAAGKLFKKGEKIDKCPKCKSPITPGLKFCPKCGTKLVITCPKCNVDYPIGTKFCGQCGGTLK